MSPDQLYVTLQQHIQAMPDFGEGQPSDDKRRWLGRAFALIAQVGDADDRARMKQLSGWLNQRCSADQASELRLMMYRMASIAEMNAPVTIRGGFINAGNPFEALVAVGQVLSQATTSIRIVDPYLDHKALQDFAVLADEGIMIELLGDAAHVHASLRPAAIAFKEQFGTSRPLEVRLSPKRTLHDRLLIIDGATVWNLTQSLNSFATRSPASIIRTDENSIELKIEAYNSFWAEATSTA